MRYDSPFEPDELRAEERDQFYGLNAYAPAPDPRKCAHLRVRELPGLMGAMMGTGICLRCGKMIDPVRGNR